jgi:hypothetical protein
MSRVVKEVYDWVQDAYDGRWDESSGRLVDYRTTFFTPDEIWRIAAHRWGWSPIKVKVKGKVKCALVVREPTMSGTSGIGRQFQK